MRSLKYFCAFLALTILFPLSGNAEEPELRGYTPPPMFGSSMSVPVETPPASAPVPEPEKNKVAKPAAVTKPPADKEVVVKDTPLPIKPLTPKAPPPKPTTVPEKTKLPPYVPPKPKAESKKEVKTATQPEAVKKQTPEINRSGLDAESLLNHPVTSQTNPMPVAQPINPLAVPASKVEGGLPLPGSVPAQKTLLQKSKKSKTETKKPAVKAKKTEPVKKQEVKKPAPKKAETKPAALKVKPKPVAKPVVKKEAAKVPAPVPVKAAPKIAEKKIGKKEEPYNVKGRKSMPKVTSTKVERAEITKLPLPAIEPPAVKTMPTPNEKMIDKSLEDRLVQPDLKKIIGDNKKEKAPAATKARLTDTTIDVPSPAPASPKAAPSQKTPEKSTSKPDLISLEFSGASSELATDQKKVIDSSIIPRLNEDNSRRLQILSFASPAKEGQSSARRISLSRGLAIRSYLLEKGIQPSRIDIRALGENTKEKPMDRVDLALIYLR